ncbi:hypothetical protein E2C01_043084 [Portunus trituberculatus]|uniref:Uncharacterized protein n=1 Tax=Portunus trituberculatus TaxID=210409 RepID=A0A5B7FUQ4_PORTR|nr:hypothetical protein [Portunus trituberculatus]
MQTTTARREHSHALRSHPSYGQELADLYDRRYSVFLVHESNSEKIWASLNPQQCAMTASYSGCTSSNVIAVGATQGAYQQTNTFSAYGGVWSTRSIYKSCPILYVFYDIAVNQPFGCHFSYESTVGLVRTQRLVSDMETIIIPGKISIIPPKVLPTGRGKMLEGNPVEVMEK